MRRALSAAREKACESEFILTFFGNRFAVTPRLDAKSRSIALPGGSTTINGEKFGFGGRRQRGKIPASVFARACNAATKPKI